MRSLVLIVLGSAVAATGVVIDRTSLVVNRKPILESQILQDIRITAYLNQQSPEATAAARKAAANRLIDQQLIGEQIRQGGYPVAPRSEAENLLQATLQDHPPLKEYGISKDELLDRMAWQLTVLRFIDARFRPQVVVSQQDVQQYYAAHRAQFRNQSMEQASPAITEQITGVRINHLLDEWLAEARKSARIVYLDRSLS